MTLNNNLSIFYVHCTRADNCTVKLKFLFVNYNFVISRKGKGIKFLARLN